MFDLHALHHLKHLIENRTHQPETDFKSHPVQSSISTHLNSIITDQPVHPAKSHFSKVYNIT